nr:MAG TPA: hypothetical protein [Caudoviricetes sp.]
MGIEVNGASMGSAAWKLLNTGLGAAGTAMGATALGSKCSEEKVRQIIREENGGFRGGYGLNRGGENVFLSVQEPCSHNTHVNRYEMQQSQRISELEAGRETDAKILDVWKAAAASDQRQDEKFAQLTKSLTDYVIASNREIDSIKCDARVNQQEIRDNLRFLDYKIDNNQREMFAYVDCKTLPLEKKLPLSSICPKPLPGCTPITTNAQVIATTPATTEGEVALNSQRSGK